jgi:imidazolonepropionase-like amidohydrolase
LGTPRHPGAACARPRNQRSGRWSARPSTPIPICNQWLNRVVSELRGFSAGRGEVLFGTDVGYTDHFDTTLEFQLMGRAGLDYRQILAALTTNPARRFRANRHSGRVRGGYDADLAVLEGDPAKDIANFARVRYAIRDGHIIYAAR